MMNLSINLLSLLYTYRCTKMWFVGKVFILSVYYFIYIFSVVL